MLFDTDILIFIERGNKKAAKFLDRTYSRNISLLTYMELMQGAVNAKQHQQIKDYLKEFDFQVLPLTENVGYRASIYIEEYALSSGLRAADSIIAATAVEHNLPLVSANKKHFKNIKELQLQVFIP